MSVMFVRTRTIYERNKLIVTAVGVIWIHKLLATENKRVGVDDEKKKDV